MFNLGKVFIVLEKATAIIGLGFIAAACGFFMFKNGLEKLINGDNQPRSYGRLKGLIITIIGVALLVLGLITILEAELVLNLLSTNVKNMLEIPIA